MALKTSLIITGDASVAKREVDSFTKAVGAAGAASRGAVGPAAELAAKTKDVGASGAIAAAQVKALESANAALGTELRSAQAAAAQAGQSLIDLRGELGQAVGQVTALETANASLSGELRQVQSAMSIASAAASEMGGAGAAAAGQIGALEAANSALAAELTQMKAAAAGADAAIGTLRASVGTAVGQVVALEGANAALVAELRETRAAVAALETGLAEGSSAALAMAARITDLETRLGAAGRATRDHTRAANDNAAAANRQQFAIRNAGQQVGDFGLSMAAGISPAQAFAQQAGQMGYALSEMGGTAGKVGAFLTGPWGIALTIAAAVGAPFVAKLFEGASAAQEQADKLAQAASAADSYGNAQSLIGKIVDLTTGKLKTQNAVLIQQIELTARANAVAAAAARTKGLKAIGGLAEPTLGETASDFGSVAGTFVKRGAVDGGLALVQTALQRGQRLAPLNRDLADYKAAATAFARVLDDPKSSTAAIESASARFGVQTRNTFDNIGRGARRAGRDVLETQQAVNAVGIALQDQAANRLVVNVARGGPVPGSLKPYERPDKPRTPRKPVSTEARDEFGRDAEAKVASIVAAFDNTPPALEKTNAQIRTLDDLIDDLNRKKPPNFAAIAASAEAAKVTVRDGLIAEIGRAFEKPKTLADQANVAFAQLDAILADLEKRRPPGYEKLIESVARAKGVIQDGLNRPMAEFLEQQDQQLQISAQILAGRSVEAEVLRQIFAIEKQRGPLSAQQKLDILGSVNALRQQERQLERNRALQQANLNALQDMQGIIAQTIYEGPESLADLPNRLMDSFKRFQADLISERIFGEMFRDLRDKVLGANKVDVATNTIVTAFGKAAASATQLSSALSGAANPGAPGAPAPGGETGPDIVVTGRKKTDSADIYGDAIAKGLGKIGLGKDAAAEIGKFAGKGLKGAFEGQAAAGFANMLGIKTSSTGSAIGGAIGGMTGLPGGAIIGGLLGGIGGALLTKPKTGSATIGAVNGETAITGTGGNNAAYRKEASGLAGSINDSINSIVSQLGGTLGNYAVSIGQRDKKFVVDTSGGGSTKFGKANDGITAYDTAEEAATAALMDAVKDGAVAGLSTAVAKALQSSPNVDKAVAEARKVQDVELAIGGIGAQIAKQFADLEATAKERVRIASAYGFDVVAIEKRNAADRLKLSEQLLKQQVGGLQSLITEITSGSLFEGSALDLIEVLNEAIAKAKVDVAAGVEGAGDTLADLYQQRLTASKDAYGTTSAYAADRNATLDEARAAVAAANARILAAQSGKTNSDPALVTTNATLDEMAEQNLRMIALAEQNGALLARIGSSGGGSSSFNLASLAGV